MKNLKVSSLFHWLYGAVMFLPILLLPVFMIYSHRHTIDSGTLEVPQNEVVDFNQLVNLQNGVETFDNLTVTTQGYEVTFNGTSNGAFWYTENRIEIIPNHKYLFKGLTNNNIYIVIGGSNTWTNPVADGVIYTSPWAENNKLGFTGTDTFNNVTFIPQFFDLTQTFGSGNEPTVQEFNQLYNASHYDYVLSRKELLQVGTSLYDDTDIMSQATYQLYNAVDKYFNIGQFFGFENLWDYMVLNWFGGNVTIYLRIFWQLLTYWLVVSIAWLIFDLFMYVPKLAHRWLDRSAIE